VAATAMHNNTTASHGNSNANARPAKNAAANKFLPHGSREYPRMVVLLSVIWCYFILFTPGKRGEIFSKNILTIINLCGIIAAQHMDDYP